jgi:hypothetical protein
MKKLAILFISFFACLAGYFLLYPHHTAEIAVERSFVLENNFDDTRKILVRTDASKRLIEAFGAEILEEKWNNVTFGVERFRPIKWDIILDGRLKVKIRQDYINEILLLNQKSQVEPDQVTSKLSLIEEAGLIQGYENHIKFYRCDEGTKVQIRMFIKIGRRIPNWPPLKSRIQATLEEEAHKTLENSEEAIRKLIKERSGKKLLLQFPFE